MNVNSSNSLGSYVEYMLCTVASTFGTLSPSSPNARLELMILSSGWGTRGVLGANTAVLS
jgi:hypothetical protein